MHRGNARFWIGVGVLAIVVATTFIAMRRERVLVEAAHNRESAELNAQIEARDQTISDLQVRLASQSQIEPVARSVSPPTPADALWQLTHRVEQLAVQQTNILTLVQKLSSEQEGLGAGQGRLQGQQRVVASLDAEAAAEEQKLEAAKQKVVQFVLNLQVPDEVALMDAAAGLDVPGLKKYWPYFEAKRERDQLQRFITIAKMKAFSEKLDLESEVAKRPPQ